MVDGVNLRQSHIEDLRVPVRRARVEVHTELERRSAVIFLAPDTAPEDVFDGSAPFFPAEEGGAIRLYARSSVISVVVDDADACPIAAFASLTMLGVMQERRSVAVHLRNGKVITGAIMLPSPFMRTLDLVNEPSKSLALHAQGKVHYVAKAYIERIEEMS